MIHDALTLANDPATFPAVVIFIAICAACAIANLFA